MEKRSVKGTLSEANFRLGPMLEPQMRAILHAMLTMSTSGVLATDLHHEALGCNAEFGRIFQVDPDRVPQMAVEELRGFVYPRLEDPSSWVKNLDEVYADSLCSYADELELINPHAWIRRSTNPLQGASGEALGRLWTFEDITDEKARSSRRDLVQRLSIFHDPDPRVVYQEVVQSVSNLYSTTVILSIQDGDQMVFRDIARPPAGAEDVPGNLLKESFCQLVLEQGAPVIVQDGRKHPKVCNILPVQLGLVRYCGVPILNSDAEPIGTLCILDSKSDEILGQDDADFMAVMGNRISVELARERIFELRTLEQRAALERQESELSATQAVLEAMNHIVESVEFAESQEHLIQFQQAQVRGLLGFENAYLKEGDGVGGPHARTWILENETFSLAFANPDEVFSEPYRAAHISAIADLVALSLTSFRLRSRLREAHDELRGAQHRLLQAEKLGVVGTLAASVAHDIRNIMASVGLEAESLGDAEEILQRVRKQIGRFSVLSHRLLSYVKPQFVAQEPCNLNEIAERAVELLAPQIRASKVKLNLALGKLPCVEADASQVEHLFVNLIVNAMQAVSRAGGEITVKSLKRGSEIRFSVSDNGRGIPPDTLERIFDPFYSSRKDGMGLGLFSCKRIATDHGWHLEAKSKLGVGSEFSLVVPIRECG